MTALVGRQRSIQGTVIHAPRFCTRHSPLHLDRLCHVATALLGLTSAAHARTDLLVYSALEADQIKAYKAALKKPIPRSS
jgi:hypothetical protein